MDLYILYLEVLFSFVFILIIKFIPNTIVSLLNILGIFILYSYTNLNMYLNKNIINLIVSSIISFCLYTFAFYFYKKKSIPNKDINMVIFVNLQLANLTILTFNFIKSFQINIFIIYYIYVVLLITTYILYKLLLNLNISILYQYIDIIFDSSKLLEDKKKSVYMLMILFLYILIVGLLYFFLFFKCTEKINYKNFLYTKLLKLITLSNVD